MHDRAMPLDGARGRPKKQRAPSGRRRLGPDSRRRPSRLARHEGDRRASSDVQERCHQTISAKPPPTLRCESPDASDAHTLFGVATRRALDIHICRQLDVLSDASHQVRNRDRKPMGDPHAGAIRVTPWPDPCSTCSVTIPAPGTPRRSGSRRSGPTALLLMRHLADRFEQTPEGRRPPDRRHRRRARARATRRATTRR